MKESDVSKVKEVLDRRALYYLKKHGRKPKSKTLLKVARALGINLPSPKELIGRLRKKGLSYRKMSLDVYGDANHVVSFLNAYVYNHSLRFDSYEKLLDYAYEQGVLKERVNLDELLRVIKAASEA